MANIVKIKGMDKVLASLKKLSNPEQLFDEALKETSVNSMRELVMESQSKSPQIQGMNTGATGRAWTNPAKVGKSHYQVSNNYKAPNSEHLVVNLINYGHKEILPKKKYLYIPLNKKAAQKKPGANIPKEYIRGQDYVLALKVSARAGTNFIEKNVQKYSRDLTSRIIKKIREALK